MSEKSILFVDDDPNILGGLANLLRKHRRRWGMKFAMGPQAALEELEKGPFDVVVSDMRMPVMDGAAFLAQVKERYPATARIVLSGHAEREAVLAAIPVAHQFLSKPCSAEHLTSVIERTCRLHALMQDEQIRELVGALDRLPSPPSTYQELVRKAEDPEIGIADLGRVVEGDPAMAVKVLQLVNSAFFGLAQPVRSVVRAVNYLGVDLLKSLVLSAHVFDVLEVSPAARSAVERIQRSSIIRGRLAGRFLSDSRQSEEAMTAAFVKDAGKIVLFQARGAEYADLLKAAETRPLPELEREKLGTTHAEVGAYLLGVWGLPFSIVEAVAYHLHPGRVEEGSREVLAAVHCANALVEELTGPGEATAEIDLAFLEAVGLAGRLEEWRGLAQQYWNGASAGERRAS